VTARLLAVALLVGCASPGPDGLPEPEVTVVPDELVPTLLTVSWTGRAGTTVGRVRFGLDGVLDGEVSEPEPTAVHELRVLGLAAGHPGTIQVEELDPDGVVLARATVELVLDDPPPELAEMESVRVPDAPLTDLLLVSHVDVDTGIASLQVVDWLGRPRWWIPPSNTYAGFSRLRRDGAAVLLPRTEPASDGAPNGTVAHVAWDGTQEWWSAPAIHHDLVELSDGTILAAVLETRRYEDQELAADVLKVFGPDGEVREVWSAWEHYPVEENRCWDILETGEGAAEWTHANGLDVDEAQGLALVSLYCQETVVAVDLANGASPWALGGTVGTLDLVGDGGFGPQHAPRLTDGGVRLFDNNDVYSEGSRVVQYGVDVFTGIAELRGEWRPPGEPWSGVLGEANAYGDGLLMSWGLGGEVYLVGPDGEILGELDSETTQSVGSVAGVQAMPLPE